MEDKENGGKGYRKRVNVLERHHDLAHRLLLVPHGAAHDVTFVGVQRLLLNVDLEQFLELALGENRADVLAERIIQRHANAFRHGVKHEQQHFDEWHESRTDRERMPRTERLWDDLAADHDKDRRQQEPDKAAREVGHEDREQAVHGDVAEHERREQHVPVLAHRQDPLRGVRFQLLFVARAVALPSVDCDFQPHFVERQQPERQPGEDRRQTHEDQDEQVPEELHDNRCAMAFIVVFVMAQRANRLISRRH
ncbi:hypothetical protein FI667_g1062, partial [Globisporangium splendens]